jgi:formate hydrogenlyase transcriptional activator
MEDKAPERVHRRDERSGTVSGTATVLVRIPDRSVHRPAEQSFRQLFEYAPDAVIVADGQGRIVLVNAQTEKLFGYRREDLIGTLVDRLIPERFRKGHAGQLSGYAVGPRSLPVGTGLELYGLKKDGLEFPVEISLSPIETEEGMFVATAIRDISERLHTRLHTKDLNIPWEFEQILSQLSRNFIGLPPAAVDGAIENGLKTIAEALTMDRATLGEIDVTTRGLIITHSWARQGIPPIPTRIVNDMLPWLLDRIRAGKITCVSTPRELPGEAHVERELMLSVGQKSCLVVPLLVGGKVIGAMSLATFRKQQTWDSVLISRFQNAADVFANAVARKASDGNLQQAYLQIRQLKDRLEQENLHLREEIKLEHNHTSVIGQSAALRSVLKKAEQVASADCAVLLLGETGTGKELFAQTIHELSVRRDRPLVKVNCAALPATLVESELFGREKGAYTGALSREIGRFELADRSDIFLDEIGELPLELQVKLLRVLQEGEFERLGSSRTLRVDVRVIAATNRDLRAAVKDGKFREDLFYRLNVFPIHLPPLRERPEDIPPLVWHVLKDISKRMGRNVDSIHSATMKAFQEYSWPGNVREVRNVIERHLILNSGSVFRAEIPELGETLAPVGRSLEEVERSHVRRVLETTRWRIRGQCGAAQILGLKPTTLEARIKKLGIRPPV